MEILSREDAKDRVLVEIKNRNHDKQFKKKFKDATKDKVHISKTLTVLMSNDYVELSDVELYWYMEALKTILGIQFDIQIKEDEAFTSQELESFELTHIDNKSEDSDTIKIENVFEVEKNREYMCVKMSYQDIAKFWSSAVNTYNFDTQREADVKSIGINVIQKPKLYRKSVEAIKDQIRKGKFKSNTITWNILKNGKEQFEYNENDNSLIFVKTDGSFLNTIDGFHRTVAFTEIVEENPDIVGWSQVKIWNFKIEEAVEYIKQEASGNPLTLEKKREMDDDTFTMFTRAINRYGNADNNELFNKIGLKKEVNSGLKYVTTETMSNSLRDNFSDTIKGANDINELEEFIIRFYNMIISEYSDVFKYKNKDNNLVKNRKNNPTVNNNAFLIYNAIARKVYDYRYEDWRPRVKKILKELNLTRSNDRLTELGIYSAITRTDLKYRKDYYDLVGELNV